MIIGDFTENCLGGFRGNGYINLEPDKKSCKLDPRINICRLVVVWKMAKISTEMEKLL